MPQIMSNFILRSKSPNFERDYFETKTQMNEVSSEWIDEGHISYCNETNKHYIFKSNDNGDKLEGSSRWFEIDLYDISKSLKNATSFNFMSVESVDDLTTELSSKLTLGAIIYVKENDTYYSNYYNSVDNVGVFKELFKIPVVKPEDEPEDEPTLSVEELTQELSELKTQYNDLLGRLSRLESNALQIKLEDEIVE